MGNSDRRFRSVRSRAFGIALLLLTVSNPAVALDAEATSTLFLTFDFDWDVQQGPVMEGDDFFLGGNLVSLELNTLAFEPGFSVPYEDNAAKIGGDTLLASWVTPDGGPYAKAESEMTSSQVKTLAGSVVPGAYNYKMSVSAATNLSGYDRFLGLELRDLEAVANAKDPQLVVTGGLLAATVALGAGSGLYAANELPSEAHAEFGFDLPLIDGPVVTIELGRVGDAVHAVVEFAMEPGLGIFDPVSNAMLSAQALEALLEGTPELWTKDGLTQDLPLFAYRYDLTGMMLPTGAAVGSYARASAFASASVLQSTVPGPPTLPLVILGTLLGATRRMYRSRLPGRRRTH